MRHLSVNPPSSASTHQGRSQPGQGWPCLSFLSHNKISTHKRAHTHAHMHVCAHIRAHTYTHARTQVHACTPVSPSAHCCQRPFSPPHAPFSPLPSAQQPSFDCPSSAVKSSPGCQTVVTHAERDLLLCCKPAPRSCFWFTHLIECI